MRRRLVIGGALLALSSSLALAQPESLLPPSFEDPPPQPSPSPTPTPRATTPGPAPRPTAATPAPQATAAPVIQDIPGIFAPMPSGPSSGEGRASLPADFPSLAELEAMEEGEINELLGLRPQFDVPPAARRAMTRVGAIAQAEGGFPSQALAGQPAALVRAALEATRGPLVSRWAHILLRRALASRLAAPEGMSPVEFAALRASVLNRMGEGHVARALVQDIDGGNYDRALADAAFDAYLATGDLLGMCPVARLQSSLREDGEWVMVQAICSAYSGEARSAERRLQRALGRGEAPEIDVRLAQRFAGAAGDAGRAVNIEWDSVDELTPWRYSLARALGADLPEDLRAGAPERYEIYDAVMPSVPLLERIAAADIAAERGVLSSAAMVDLYSQLYASDFVAAGDRAQAAALREAYVASDPSARMAAIRELWGDSDDFGRRVLTAYAAARLPVSDSFQEDAGAIIGSMLTAGLDRNAVRWGDMVDEGSEAWALLALAQPGATVNTDRGAVDDFLDADTSTNSRKSRFLVAGLAGLGRLDANAAADFAGRLGVNLDRASPWSTRIDRAGEYGNPVLVAMLAGLGMQGDSWEKMTARQLFHIVRALDRAGLNAEARMIAAEAVARA